MIEEIIKELSNRGIAYRGEVDGLLMFEGMENGYKSAFDLDEYQFHAGTESDPDFVVNAILSDVNLRRTEWEQVGLSKADPVEAETFVAMKTGERGGKHVLINGTWYYASKEV